MLEFKQKQQFKRRLYSRSVLIVLVIIGLFFGQATWGIYKKKHDSELKADQAIAELKALKERQKELSLDVQKLNTDRGVEEEIRDKFSVTKPNEHMVVIVDNKNTALPPLPKQSFFQKIWSWIKSL
ncbi:septum formation initiator family protein [Candidatus Parcubacteria bacterium]|nr:septum formation initiator family protein [Candidatus Parcubacteria bacterium]